jgi:hypothetical protein
LTTLTGTATGSVATTAQNITVSVSPTAQTGVLTTASTMVLPPAGTGTGVYPVAWGQVVPGTGSGATLIPAWVPSAVGPPILGPWTLTMTRDQFASTVKGGTLPATVYINWQCPANWFFTPASTTAPQGSLCTSYGVAPAGTSLLSFVFTSNGNPNNNSFTWVMWSSGTAT